MEGKPNVYEKAYIRSVDYLNSKDAALAGSFLDAKNKKIPLVYQYCQTKKPNEDANTQFGYCTNFRVDKGNMVCDVVLNPLSQYCSHFQGVIDNYTVNINNVDSQLVFTVSRLIIYDKDFKAKRDQEIMDNMKNNPLSKQSYPLSKNSGKLVPKKGQFKYKPVRKA